MSRTSVVEPVREPLEAPEMTGGSWPEGGEGRARYALERLSALCQRACQAEMASSLDCWFWAAMVSSSQWLGGQGAVTWE